MFQCIAENKHGLVYSSAELKVMGKTNFLILIYFLKSSIFARSRNIYLSIRFLHLITFSVSQQNHAEFLIEAYNLMISKEKQQLRPELNPKLEIEKQ